MDKYPDDEQPKQPDRRPWRTPMTDEERAWLREQYDRLNAGYGRKKMKQ